MSLRAYLCGITLLLSGPLKKFWDVWLVGVMLDINFPSSKLGHLSLSTDDVLSIVRILCWLPGLCYWIAGSLVDSVCFSWVEDSCLLDSLSVLMPLFCLCKPCLGTEDYLVMSEGKMLFRFYCCPSKFCFYREVFPFGGSFEDGVVHISLNSFFRF